MQTFKNLILRSLDAETIKRLMLKQVTFEVGHQLEVPGEPIREVYFVESGIASLTAGFSDGSQVEAGMFGYDSVIGVAGFMGVKRSLNRVYTQVPGSGYMCSVGAAQREFLRCGSFQRMTLRYVQMELLSAIQSAGCNAKHNMEQRLARWLLICAERAYTDTLQLSQEFLADMLGSTRASVTLAAGPLREEGLIDYRRGVIRILDRKGLEAATSGISVSSTRCKRPAFGAEVTSSPRTVFET